MPDVKPERPSYRQRQALETRRLIARAARALFTEHGYAATSIETVASEAGVSPRTVYASFGTKKAILGAICEEWLMEAGVMEAIATGLADPTWAAGWHWWRVRAAASGSRIAASAGCSAAPRRRTPTWPG